MLTGWSLEERLVYTQKNVSSVYIFMFPEQNIKRTLVYLFSLRMKAVVPNHCSGTTSATGKSINCFPKSKILGWKCNYYLISKRCYFIFWVGASQTLKGWEIVHLGLWYQMPWLFGTNPKHVPFLASVPNICVATDI